ncbi:MAG: hypothetical protein QOJ19_343 [Acidimicrobiia bacterium]|jgi:tetratricopeptide (TPR) repeat protein|nr:hypothetical protein [Acidimicrobiia bacterium]
MDADASAEVVIRGEADGHEAAGGSAADGKARRPRPGKALSWIGPAIALLLIALSLGRFLHGAGRGSSSADDSVTGPASAQVGLAGTGSQDIAALDAATRARPDDPHAWQQLGSASLRDAIRTLDPASYERATSALQRARQLAPTDPTNDVLQGTLALSLHHFDQALGFGQAALGRRPDNVEALGVVVDAQVELGRYDEAQATLQRMLDQRPSLPALSRASYQRELRGDLDGALVAMVQAEVAGGGTTAVGPSDTAGAFDVATIVSLQGDILWQSGRVDEAARRYDEALRLSPDLPGAVIGLARTEAVAGRTTDAIDRLDRLVRKVPLPAAATLLGDLQAGLGRSADAARNYELVRLTYRLQQASGAAVDLEQALFEADHGGEPQATLGLAASAYSARKTIYAADALAWARHRAGDDAGAIAALSEAGRLGTKDPLLHYHAAAALTAVGQVDAAKVELRQSIDANPWFTFSPAVRAEAAALADQLGIDTPSWRNHR